MTIKLPASVLNFAAGDTVLFDNFVDYFNHYRSENGTKQFAYIKTDKEGKPISLAQKEEALKPMLLREISKRSGVDVSSMPAEVMSTHPLVGWSVANIASQLIDAVLPSTMVEGTSAYAEIKTIGYGETGIFDIKSRDLFAVTKVGKLGMREAELQKGYMKQVTLTPEAHMITVGVSLFRVLSGQESLADFTVKALRSIETEMTKDIYTAFATAMAALDTDATTGLKVTGYTQQDLTILAQKVSAFSGGAKPIVLGTKVALANILPEDPNYRYDLSSPFVTLGYVRTIAGIDTFEIPQIANWENPFSTYVSDSYLWIVAPGTDKLIKCVIGGAMVSHVAGQFDSALLLQNASFVKFWKAGLITSSVAASIDLS